MTTRPFRLPSVPNVAVVSGLVALGAALGASPVAADRLVTGRDIRDGSLTGRDLRNGTVAARDLAPAVRRRLGRVGAAASPGAPGPPGPSGAAGARGPDGVPGAAGPPARIDPSRIEVVAGDPTTVQPTLPPPAFTDSVAVAACPRGWYVVGGGFDAGGALIRREEAAISGASAAWFVFARNDTGADVIIQAYAVCLSP